MHVKLTLNAKARFAAHAHCVANAEHKKVQVLMWTSCIDWLFVLSDARMLARIGGVRSLIFICHMVSGADSFVFSFRVWIFSLQVVSLFALIFEDSSFKFYFFSLVNFFFCLKFWHFPSCPELSRFKLWVFALWEAVNPLICSSTFCSKR